MLNTLLGPSGTNFKIFCLKTLMEGSLCKEESNSFHLVIVAGKKEFSKNLLYKKYTIHTNLIQLTHRKCGLNVMGKINILNCSTSNCVYLITCCRCAFQYVGETVQYLRDRFSGHRNLLYSYRDFFGIS